MTKLTYNFFFVKKIKCTCIIMIEEFYKSIYYEEGYIVRLHMLR